jgi:hypothetical protein
VVIRGYVDDDLEQPAEVRHGTSQGRTGGTGTGTGTRSQASSMSSRHTRQLRENSLARSARSARLDG